MSRPPLIADFALDDENVDKMWGHGISPEQVTEVLYNRPVAKGNRKNRHGAFLLVGRDNGGAWIAITVEPTSEPRTWGPITEGSWQKTEAARLRL